MSKRVAVKYNFLSNHHLKYYNTFQDWGSAPKYQKNLRVSPGFGMGYTGKSDLCTKGGGIEVYFLADDALFT